MKPLYDTDLLQREYYNPNKFNVEFWRLNQFDFYVIENKGHQYLGPHYAILKPDTHLYLPHGYYLIKGQGLKQGEKFELITNLEKMMFKGNKTPSNIYGQNG